MPFDGAEFGQAILLDKIDRVLALLASEDRWCKGVLRSVDGRRCLAGALIAAEAQALLTPVLLQAIREVTGHKHWRIEAFNDRASTSHAQVLAVLHRARDDILAGRAQAAIRPPRLSAAWQRVIGLAR
jgi:hypothetical protein